MSAGPWLVNGDLVPGPAASLSPWDRGFRFGDGVYETLRVHSGVVIRRAEHLDRMAEGLAILELDVDPDRAFPAADLDRLLAAAGLRNGEGRMRLYVTRGIDRGTARPPSTPDPTRLATVEPLPEDAPPSDPRPLALAVVEAAFPRPVAWSGLKSLNHLPYVLAAAKAARAGADEALLVYEERIKETTAANVFVVESGCPGHASAFRGRLGRGDSGPRARAGPEPRVDRRRAADLSRRAGARGRDLRFRFGVRDSLGGGRSRPRHPELRLRDR